MALFDQEAVNYDKWYETRMGKHVDKVETECAFSLFQIKPGMQILDVGCGSGNFSIKMAHQGALVTGVDISEKMLEIARKKAEKEKLDIRFIQMDSRELQFPENYFDGVISMATIEFIPEPEKMITEMFRVCKKDRYVLVGTINRESQWGRLYQDLKFQEHVPVFKSAYFKSPEDLSKYKKDALIKVREYLFIPPDTLESDINQKKEEELAGKERGGFFCVLWQKK